jgi:hypothetical protein
MLEVIDLSNIYWKSIEEAYDTILTWSSKGEDLL